VAKADAVISGTFKDANAARLPCKAAPHLPSLLVLRGALESALTQCDLTEDRREHALAALALVEAACAETSIRRSILRRHLRHATRHLQLMGGTPTSLEWDEACAAARRAMTATFFELENLAD
jgi:hypothetical protein